MYVAKNGGDYSIILQMGDVTQLKKGEVLSNVSVSGKARQSILVRLGKTKRPNMDVHHPYEGTNNESASIVIDDYGRKFLEEGPTFGVLCGSHEDGTRVSIVNRYWEKPQ
jgi:hypothetical protein